MSWNDQDIDQLFKGAKAPEPAAFQESFWSEMEAMLPEQKRKKAGLWWIVSGAAALLLLAGGGFWLAGQPAGNTQLAGPMKPFLGSNHYEYVSKSMTDLPQPAKAIVTPVITENTIESTAYQNVQRQNPGIRSSNTTADFSLPSREMPEVTSAEHLAANSTDMVDQPVEELVIAEDLPKMELFYQYPQQGGLYAATGDVPADCETYRTCAAKSINFPKPARFYLQTSAGIGQSAQHVAGKSDLVHFYSVGGGLYKKLDRMVFTFGAAARVDFAKNILYTTYPSSDTRIDTKYSQLYSFEMPVSIGYEAGRNSIVATVTPGFQTAFSGNQQETHFDEIVRSEQAFGKISDAKTLTMEIGATYWRSMTPNWYLGVGMNVDILKPFNSAMYAGEQRLLPLNGQLSLRRTF
jgi:hypothetical protein